MDDQARERMVKLIAARGVQSERVLAAMRVFPRHELVPEELRGVAYDDRALPIGDGQTISQPFVVAFMIEAAGVRPGSRVLEVGTGSGYQAAIMAGMGADVYSMEIRPELARRAQEDLRRLGVTGIRLRTGDGSLGWVEAGPFDAILVAAGAPEVPPALLEQLADGGRLVIPVGGAEGEVLEIHERHGAELRRVRTLPVRFVPLVRETLH